MDNDGGGMGKGSHTDGGGTYMGSHGANHGILHKIRHDDKAFLQTVPEILQQLQTVMHRTFSSPSFLFFL